ncbi:MAG: fibronectin type III domain-containing protein [Eubacterium sp.]|nr:fibronectin type III domain-containing protein [Eubacterium sp.]
MNNKTKRISLIAVITAIIAAFLTSAIVYADDNISIENTFKDPVFRDAVALQYDTDGDGELSPDERSVEVMIVSGLVDELANSRGVDSDTLTISSLEGIECFSNLKVLRCNDIGELDSLDVSALTSLETLNCSDDGLTSLDLSANTELRVLHCCSNEFTSLDFTANTKLEFLHCYANLELESLNVSGLANLEELRCDGCKINSLDLTTNTSLYKLNCSYNHIAKIDLSSTAATSLTNYHLGNQTISLELTYSDGKITAPIDLDADSVYATSLDSDGTAYADGAFFTTEYSNIKDGFTYDYSTGKSGCAEMKVSVSVYHTHTYAVTASDFENKKLTINCQICGGDEHILDAELATVTDEPSCTAAGKTTKTLTAQFDGKTYTDVDETEIPALNHDYVPVVTPPTCTEQGYTTYTCSRCDDSYVTDYTDALNHTAGETVIENEVPATCTADGSYDEVVYCTTCNEELSRETKTVEKLGHDLGEWTVTAPAVPVTCMTDGKAAIETCYCSRCDYYENRGGETITAQGHKNGEPVKENEIPATCTADGSYDEVVYCTVCTQEISRDTKTVGKLGHDLGGWTVTAPAVPATCMTDGKAAIETCYCSRCDYYENRGGETISAPGHTNGEPVKENEVAATCTADGSYDEVVYCTVCTQEISRDTKTVEKLGHDLGGWTVTTPAVPATCTTDGKAAIETCHCSRCDYYETRGGETIAALNHNYKAVAVAPTCTAKGYTKHTCTRCGDSYTDSETAALGHKWNSGVVTVDPTTTSEGKKKFTCTLCNAVRYETIPKLKVSEVTPNEKEADSAKVNKTIKKPTQIHTISLNKKKQFYIYFNAVKGAQNYRIMYRKVGDKGWKKSWTKGKTEFTIKNLKANGLYEFKFAAYRKNAKGKWERGGYSTTSYRYYYKAVITKTKVAKNTVTVNWKRNKNANYYTVEYATNREMKNSKKVNISPNSKTSYKIKGLKKEKKYFIRIRAVKKSGGKSYIGEFSTRKAVTIK